jgi:hypothetical protein
MISQQAGSGNSQQGFNVEENTAQTITFMVSNGGGNFGGGNASSVPLSQWHHFVFVYNNGTQASYMDGTLINSGSGATATIGANTMDLLFGQANWSNINAINYDGILDDIGIWNTALTQTEVTALYNASNTSCNPNITTGLVAQYDFTGNANDLSGNGNNGTIVGATLTTDRFGNANSAYSFDGDSNYIFIPNAILSSTQTSYTINYWSLTYSTAASGAAYMVINDRYGSDVECKYKYDSHINSSNQYDIRMYDYSSMPEVVSPNSSPNNTWVMNTADLMQIHLN